MDAIWLSAAICGTWKLCKRLAMSLACLLALGALALPTALAARGSGTTGSANSRSTTVAPAAAGSTANGVAGETGSVGGTSISQAQPAVAPPTSNGTPGNDSKTDADKSDAGNFTADAIAARIKELEAASDADQPDRAAQLELYRQALDDLKKTDAEKARITELEKQRIAAPYQLEIRQRESAAKSAGQTNTAPALPAGAPLDHWEQMLSSAEQDLETAQKTLAAKEKEKQRRAARRLEIPQAIAAARIKLDELHQAASDASAASPDTSAITQARHVARHARRLALESEIALAEKELQAYDATASELLSLEQDEAAQAVEEAQQRVAAWQEAVNTRREAEANQQVSEAHWAAAAAVPAIRQLAEDNSALADERQQLAKTVAQLAGERAAVLAKLSKVSDQFKQATDKLSATGLTESIGQMLLKQRSELGQVEADRHALRQRQDEISRVQLELFEFQEQQDDLRNLDSRVKEICGSLPTGTEVKPDDVHRLLDTKRKYLQALVEDDNSYFSALVDVDSKQRELLTKADAFRDYIDERVLWIRSTHPLSLGDVGKAVAAVAWSVKPANWWAALSELADGLRGNVFWSLLAIALFVPWVWAQRRLRQAILHWGQAPPVENSSHGHAALRRACQTAVATLLIAAVWPAMVWFVGWLLVGGTAGHGEFPEALGAALQTTACVLLPLLLIRQICRHDGLAQSHFGWPGDLLLALRRQLTWLAVFGTPAILIVTMLEAQSVDAWKDSLGRIAFIAGQLLAAGFVYAALKPPLGTLHRLMVLRSDTWTNRLALPMFFILLALPLALAALASAGYYYTALRLACRLQTTVWFILGLVTVHALASIWLTGVYRRLAIKAAARKINSLQPLHRHAGFAAGGSSPTLHPSAAISQPTYAIDEEKVDAQTHRLLHNLATLALVVGLCWVWFDMFPALQFFNQVTLWHDASDSNHPIDITLANLLAAGMIAALTIVGAGNLPSLLEIAVLERVAPDHGIRYALVAVTRYIIVVVGLALASAAIGIGWGKLQWLIAAMSFGLGFGLQEIFANFISGLIVLLERPIRIGDTVTVGDVTGTVSRIQMRATTIVDADRKELILPNKDLISGRLVNWTLTDSVIRLVVRVGVAYGSDTEQAQRLLLEVAARTPEVLKTPPPKAVFMGFGEKSLDFELRVFVGHVDALLPVRHQLNMAIDRSFHAARVELAFAQADTFVRHVEESQRALSQPAEQPKAA
ncbi:MAG TPA: mechanosensitive ion channel domain-containing protein [Pirellulales bacterium]|jgi:potassium efflux system protein|nr:mechanosensitive ion channel domain-containing protein [Pirellulales bacterium]